ncbi:kinesin-like protein kif23 [Moniliophthora roreri]|nr:kinesin-like protein kif23 [Moniliophthora roreri]
MIKEAHHIFSIRRATDPRNTGSFLYLDRRNIPHFHSPHQIFLSTDNEHHSISRYRPLAFGYIMHHGRGHLRVMIPGFVDPTAARHGGRLNFKRRGSEELSTSLKLPDDFDWPGL